MDAGSVSPAGGSQPHDNMHPFVCIHHIIALFGIFPTFN
jgi:microcystin-dependent protein